MHAALLAATLAFTAPALLAQNPWVVDALNRPGTTHTTLNAAVASSQPGDRIRVRDGSNTVIGLVIDRPLRIYGDPGAMLSATLGSITVQNIPAGTDFAMSGLTLSTGPFTSQRLISFTNCAGRILLDNLQGATSGSAAFSVMTFDQVQHAVLDRVTFSGPDAVIVRDSTAVITASDISHSALVFGRGPQAAALACVHSRVFLAETTVTGAPGTPFAPAGTLAIYADNATLRIGTASVIAAGAGSGQMAVDGVVSTITADPAVSLSPSGASPATGPGVSVVRAPVPTLQSVNELATATVRVTLHGGAGQLAGIVIGWPGNRLSVPAVGEIWLDPASLVTVMIGVPSGDLVFTTPLVSNPAFLGAPVHWQGAVLSANGVTLTNPSGYMQR